MTDAANLDSGTETATNVATEIDPLRLKRESRWQADIFFYLFVSIAIVIFDIKS